MEFKQGTPVKTADGKTVGHIRRFVIDPNSNEITDLVVEKGFLFTEDRVVPVKAIASSTQHEVVLQGDAGEPDDFPVFEEDYYVRPYDGDVITDPVPLPNYPVYYYPPLGTPGWYAPMGPDAQYVRKTVQNTPTGTVAVEEGAPVYARDDEHVGDVARVFTAPNTDRVTHFAISQGLLFKHEKLVPMTWITRLSDDEVRLAVSSETLENLPDFEG
ncbi:MAG: PRC-barrel domain-containing protein [Anaerolineae bacterium]|nr:PRC-barrel domain-containing protein [Anaerolineae bacterium]